MIPVVAGFQGVSASGDVTTLGRGASDTTAVALAVALGADHCEINTDVNGIYSADPRVEPNARKLDRLVYEETLEMASLGAKVMHPRSIEVAQRHNLRVVVRSSFNRNPGTNIVSSSEIDIETGAQVRAVVHNANVARITVLAVPDRPGLATAIFQPLADSGVNVDVIVQNLAQEGNTDISFSVERTDLKKALDLVSSVAKEIDAGGVASSSDLGTISIVGMGMQSSPGVAAQMFGALASFKINITSITTSEIRITCLIDENRLEDAVRVLHESFGLGHL
jgi:aspartate kinase